MGKSEDPHVVVPRVIVTGMNPLWCFALSLKRVEYELFKETQVQPPLPGNFLTTPFCRNTSRGMCICAYKIVYCFCE